MAAEPHPLAWFIPSPEHPEDLGYGGVVVELGDANGARHWWVLCPAAATLEFESSAPLEDTLGNPDAGWHYSNPYCTDGDACDHVEWHRLAAQLILDRRRGES